MDRVFESGAAVTPPEAPSSPSSGYPTPGNPSTATAATKPGAYWYHMITESLRRVIVAAGLDPDHTDLDRFKNSIVALGAAALTAATEAAAGVLRIATNAETNAGAADDRIVTPKKLLDGFAVSFGASGYIQIPNCLGRWKLNWITSSAAVGGSNYSWPLAFDEVICATFPAASPNNSAYFGVSYNETLNGVSGAVYNTSGITQAANWRCFAVGR